MLNAKIYLPNGSLAAVQPFQNPDMVKAFNYAWNESYYVESVLNGLGIANPGLLMQGELGYQNYTPYFQENLTAAANDITKACQSLGCSPNNPLHIVMAVINDPDSEGAATLLASNINSLQAGVRLDLNPGTFNAALSFFLSKTEGVFLGEFSTNPVDPLVSPLGFFGNINSGFAAIFTYYNDSNTISLLNQAATVTNVTQRAQLYTQIDQAIAQSGHYIKIAQFQAVVVTSMNVKVAYYNEWISVYLPTLTELTAG